MTTHLLTFLPAVIAASFIQPDVPELPIAGKVIHGLQPRNDHVLATTELRESSVANSNSECVLSPVNSDRRVKFVRLRRRPAMRDAASERAVARSAPRRFPCFNCQHHRWTARRLTCGGDRATSGVKAPSIR